MMEHQILKLAYQFACPDQLAEVKEANDIAGYVTETASKETGLAVGTPVIVGTDDSGAEAISTGVVPLAK